MFSPPIAPHGWPAATQVSVHLPSEPQKPSGSHSRQPGVQLAPTVLNGAQLLPPVGPAQAKVDAHCVLVVHGPLVCCAKQTPAAPPSAEEVPQ